MNVIAQLFNGQLRLSFREYMEQALYHPTVGYYTNPHSPLGTHGDFITAPTLSPLFARCLANQCLELKSEHILEIGAGNGQLVVDLLTALKHHDFTPQYYIYDISPARKKEQFHTIASQAPHLFPQITWLDTLETQISGLIIANEVLDAMPVHRFCVDQHTLQEWGVVVQNHQLSWTLMPLSDPLLREPLLHIQQHLKQNKAPFPYSSEINLALPSFLAQLEHCLVKGLIVLIDYGFPFQELYHPERYMGTLMCHHKHRAIQDLLLRPCEMDITAHVDFTAVARAGLHVGLELMGYTHQAGFLINCGLIECLNNPSPTETHAVNLLTSPAEMGELFKLIGFGKGLEKTPLGFTQFNRIPFLGALDIPLTD